LVRKRAVAIRHVHFEDLGTLAPALTRAGYDVFYSDAAKGDLGEDADLLIVLGGPIGAYEECAYPFLTDELATIDRHLSLGRPALGICLGAQLIARALGSRVYPSGMKEIGWSELTLSAAGRTGPLRHLEGVEVLHWHGDTFDLPEGCELLASTEVCRNQAFARGPTVLALQFHVEVEASGLESWLVGHACELAEANINPADLRRRSRAAASRSGEAGTRLFDEWLAALA
jgi:GMP synthase (glutamine-hydrolysing)